MKIIDKMILNNACKDKKTKPKCDDLFIRENGNYKYKGKELGSMKDLWKIHKEEVISIKVLFDKIKNDREEKINARNT